MWLFDERRPVTARYLSLVLSLSPTAARRLLAAYYRRHRGEGKGGKGLKATFLVVGQGERGGKEVLLLPEERVQGACVAGRSVYTCMHVCMCVYVDGSLCLHTPGSLYLSSPPKIDTLTSTKNLTEKDKLLAKVEAVRIYALHAAAPSAGEGGADMGLGPDGARVREGPRGRGC